MYLIDIFDIFDSSNLFIIVFDNHLRDCVQYVQDKVYRHNLLVECSGTFLGAAKSVLLM